MIKKMLSCSELLELVIKWLNLNTYNYLTGKIRMNYVAFVHELCNTRSKRLVV